MPTVALLGRFRLEGVSVTFCILALTITSAAAPPGVELKFISQDFVIESAEAIIVNSASFEPPGDRVVLPDGKIVFLPDATESAQPFALREGIIRSVPFSQAGTYTALLMGLTVLRRSDKKRFHVRQFSIAQFLVTQSDLFAGAANVPFDPGGIFRVVVLDKRGKHLPGQSVSFSGLNPKRTGRIRSVQIKSDENGEIIVLGRPEDFHIAPVGNPESLKLEVSPL